VEVRILIYLKLFITFIKIGLFSFGGGYAMIPLIQREIELHGWLTSSEFIDIIAIAEMTPGPIAVNSATFVGFKTAGVLGGLVSTIGVAMPSLVLILLISKHFFRFKDHPLNTAVFYGIRPVIVGLITTASIFVSQTALFKDNITADTVLTLFTAPFNVLNMGSVLIFILTMISLIKFKLNPIVVIIGSGILGILLN